MKFISGIRWVVDQTNGVGFYKSKETVNNNNNNKFLACVTNLGKRFHSIQLASQLMGRKCKD